MRKIFNYIAVTSGHRDTNHLIDSAFHPDQYSITASVSWFFAGVAYVFEHIFGIHLMVGVILVVLFFLEIYTGVKASKKEGVAYDSNLMKKGWVQLIIYLIMIGCTYLLSVYVPHKQYAGIDINIYAFLHYAFYNYVLINLLISNIENFIRLDWNFKGFIPWIGRVLNLRVWREKEDQNAGK